MLATLGTEAVVGQFEMLQSAPLILPSTYNVNDGARTTGVR